MDFECLAGYGTVRFFSPRDGAKVEKRQPFAAKIPLVPKGEQKGKSECKLQKEKGAFQALTMAMPEVGMATMKPYLCKSIRNWAVDPWLFFK